MKSKVIFYLLMLISVEIFGQDVAKYKCEEYSRIRKSRFKFLTRVEVGEAKNDDFTTVYEGIIISENFVITETTRYPANLVQLSFISLQNQNFTTEDYYEIKKIHFPPNYNEASLDYRAIYALVELKHKIVFNEQFYPQCIWPYKKFNNTHVITYGWTVKSSNSETGTVTNSKFQRKSYERLSKKDCNSEINFGDKDVQECFKRTDDQHEDVNNYFYVEFGSPLEIEVEKEKYAVGLILSNHYSSRLNSTVIFSVPFYYYIEWIENIVWKRSTLATTGCGIRVIKPKVPLVSFSNPTYHGEFPWHVALYQQEKNHKKRYICGGTIISQEYVLTAAHCLVSEIGTTLPERLTIEVGKYRLDLASTNSYEIPVHSVITHEKYNTNYLENDIALLKLENLIIFSEYVQPICLTNQKFIYKSNIGIVPGWGRNEFRQNSNILAKVSLPIRSQTECRDSNRQFFTTFLNNGNFCAGYQNGTNVCLGDSGGGMVFEGENERWYINGIVSLGVSLPDSGFCDITELTLFTDVTKFHDWIIDKTKNE